MQMFGNTCSNHVLIQNNLFVMCCHINGGISQCAVQIAQKSTLKAETFQTYLDFRTPPLSVDTDAQGK